MNNLWQRVTPMKIDEYYKIRRKQEEDKKRCDEKERIERERVIASHYKKIMESDCGQTFITSVNNTLSQPRSGYGIDIPKCMLQATSRNVSIEQIMRHAYPGFVIVVDKSKHHLMTPVEYERDYAYSLN